MDQADEMDQLMFDKTSNSNAITNQMERGEGGISTKKMQTTQMASQNKSIHTTSLFNFRQWEGVQIRRKMFGGGGISKKIQTSQMPFQNESIQQVSSK